MKTDHNTQHLHFLKIVHFYIRALTSFLETDAYVRTVQKAVAEYQRRIFLLHKWVVKYFPAGTRITKPQGGFLLWIEMPENVNAIELTRKALEKNISIGLGVLYSRRQIYSHHIRLSCADADLEKMEKAVEIIGKLAIKLNRHLPK